MGRRFLEPPILISDCCEKPQLMSTAAKGFIQIPISELTTSLNDFQGRADAYSSQTYNRIINEVKAGTFNPSALPPIQIWKDPRSGEWVILAGHSRTAAFKDLSSGGQRSIPTGDISKFSSIAAQIVEAKSLDEAKKIALESNQGAVQTDLDNARYAKELRGTIKNKTQYYDKLKDLYGKNWVYVNELSYLNPDGKAVSMVRQLQEMSDQSQKLTIEKIASFLGAVRERVPALTNAHEDELYDWLVKNINNPKTNNKIEFIANIGARTMRLDFDPAQPLNLERVATKTYIDESYEQQVQDVTNQIKEKQAEMDANKKRYITAGLSVHDIETKLDPIDHEIIALQSKLQNLLLKKGEVSQANKSILGLFDNPAPATEKPNHEALEKKLATLLDILTLHSPNLATTGSQISNSPEIEGIKEPELTLKDLLETKPDAYMPLHDARIVKYSYNIKSGKVEAYNYPYGRFTQSAEIFYSLLLKTGTDVLKAPENYQPFRSTILNEDFLSGNPAFNYQVLIPFLLDQLDWWLYQFEQRFNVGAVEEKDLSKYGGYDTYKVSKENGYNDAEMLKQITETAIHIFADSIIRNTVNPKEAYGKLIFFYDKQPKITTRSSNSLKLQQYSTPVIMGYLMSKFCVPVPTYGDEYLEPSAGTGLLTIGTPPSYWTVNEIDRERLTCLKFMGFKNTFSQDSNQPLPWHKNFAAVITNPPFGNGPPYDFDGYKIRKLEHRMAAFALQHLREDGRAAIIIGQNMQYGESSGMIEPPTTDRVFFSWLYEKFNVKDVINVQGFLYSRMGAVAPVRIILIDGRRQTKGRPFFYHEIENLPANMPNSNIQVRDAEVLFERVFGESGVSAEQA